MKIRTEEFPIKLIESKNGSQVINDLNFDYITDVYVLIGNLRKKVSKFSWSITTKTLWIYIADIINEIRNKDLSNDVILCINYMSISEDRDDKLNELIK